MAAWWYRYFFEGGQGRKVILSDYDTLFATSSEDFERLTDEPAHQDSILIS